DLDKAKQQFAQARTDLLDKVDKFSDAECLHLAQVLAGGMIITKFDGKVYAVERKVQEEVKAVEERLQKIRETVAKEKFQELLGKIEKVRGELVKDAQEFAKSNDHEALRTLAREGVKERIEKVKGYLADLDSKISAATEERAGMEKLRQITEYDLEAE